MYLGSFELPHNGLGGNAWREQFSTYVMLMLAGFQDTVMTSMITKPTPIMHLDHPESIGLLF